MSQVVIKNKFEVKIERKEKKIAFFKRAGFKSWANVLGVLALSGLIFLASLFM
ncbi:hypothetical protein [uncultured Clostridium sp.]|uniref:hypothetical protein n=1 Tax=uncultured Clostridium sp. TaxID=59620 RepID=UPI00260513CA|nr:hypothetical protein [uncultured Clostridium sp.]